MKYRNRADGSLVTKSQLKAENRNISFPKLWKTATLESLGVDPVLAGPKPEAGEYEVAVADGAVQDGGNWVEAWKVQPMFNQYVDDDGKAVSVDEQIAEYEANKLLKKRQGLSATNESLRLQLDQIGVYGVMSAAVATLDAKAEYEGVDVTPYAIHWGYATTINRLDAWVTEVAEAAGITDEQLDDLFEASSGVNTAS
jgi:hypothetical protein